jgi:hypothetical protein
MKISFDKPNKKQIAKFILNKNIWYEIKCHPIIGINENNGNSILCVQFENIWGSTNFGFKNIWVKHLRRSFIFEGHSIFGVI